MTHREPISRNDYDLLPLDQVEPFQVWLSKHGCAIKQTGSGQHFQVMTTLGWAPVQRGKQGAVVTPIALRSVIQDFLKAPLGRSVHMGTKVTSTRQLFIGDLPETPANDAQAVSELVARAIGKPALKQPAQAKSNIKESLDRLGASIAKGEHLFVASEPTAVAAPAQADPLPADGHSLEAHVPLIDQRRAVRDLRLATQAPAPTKKASQDLLYLNDLRDDFAMHAPLQMGERESMAAFAARRWAYADSMIEQRPAQFGA